jgi:23S rRNA (adenine2503-C2)-methyltransferase
MYYKQAIVDYLKDHKIPAYRGCQILHAIYKEGCGNYQDIKVLPKDIKEMLSCDLPIFSFEILKEVSSDSGDTVKTLFKLKDGACVEGVLMLFKDSRASVCVSSQVGCGLKCAFCATGQMGFKRNLTDEEIADQVLYFDQYLKKKDSSFRVTHVVFMGMGEPMLNYENVISAIKTLNDPDCLEIAARHITVSTSGVIPGIKRLTDEDIQVNLAVSLHAPNQILREQIMPIAKAYKLTDLMDALKQYIEKTKRRVSYEYVMLKDTNDSSKLAKELAALLRGQLCHVNLIPYNETRLGFVNAGRERIKEFKEILESFKIPVTVRVSLGQDISAACGQLAGFNSTSCEGRL